MFRTQPPGFRWLVGGFALLAALAFGLQYRTDHDGAELILGVLCLLIAGYWLVIDRFVDHSDPDELSDDEEDNDAAERWPDT